MVKRTKDQIRADMIRQQRKYETKTVASFGNETVPLRDYIERLTGILESVPWEIDRGEILIDIDIEKCYYGDSPSVKVEIYYEMFEDIKKTEARVNALIAQNEKFRKEQSIKERKEYERLKKKFEKTE